MERVHRLFMWLIIIGPIHMTEQLFTSIEEFYMLRDQLGGYYRMFDPTFADSATVILITIVVTVMSLMLYGMLVGGRGRMAVLWAFALMGAGEAHHVITALTEFAYDPGVVTSVAYASVGALMVRELWRTRHVEPSMRFQSAGI